MKGARALAGGMLVLVATCAVPAISAAQDAGTASTTTTTPTAPADPATPGAPSGKPQKPKPPEASPTEPAAGTPSEAASSSGETPTQLRRGSPADGSGGGARKSSSASVSMVNFAFSPSSVTVNAGDTVTWSNQDEAPHNATADDGSFSTPNINRGQSASHRFTQSGTFSYICTIHPNMHGTVRVLASSSGESGGGAGSSSSGSSQSESSAVASPDAAGDANTLPMTGMAAGALALVGFALLASGLVSRLAGRRRSHF